jgi:hypothetical protein
LQNSLFAIYDLRGVHLHARTKIGPRCSADFPVGCIAGFQTRERIGCSAPADLGIGVTAGWETCATGIHQPTSVFGFNMVEPAFRPSGLVSPDFAGTKNFLELVLFRRDA